MYLEYLDRYQELISHTKQGKYICSQIVFEVQLPRSPELNAADFLSVGTLKVLVYSVEIENKQTLYQRVLRSVRPFATAPEVMKF